MKIIEPNLGDFKRIAEIHNEANKPFRLVYSSEEKEAFGEEIETEETIEEIFKTRKLLVAENEENFILGYVIFRKKNDEVVWISSLFVDPKFQRQAIGEKLLKSVEEYAVKNNCKLVTLETHRKANWAIDFYKKQNYEIVNDKVNEYPYNKILDKAPVENRPLLATLIG